LFARHHHLRHQAEATYLEPVVIARAWLT
jgi:hypothetical protein